MAGRPNHKMWWTRRGDSLQTPGVWKAVQLALFLIVIGALRCVNFSDVFVANGVHFIDADCYARMTRAAAVFEEPGRIIRRHAFENWPEGTVPHTTAPLDYLIAGLAWVITAFSTRALDLAGAFISPLLALAGGAFLWCWCGPLRYRGMMMLLYAVSPVLVHATALGRPDHQGLLLVLMAVALGAEWKLLTGAHERNWSICAGAMWGLALWVSLFEPAILFGLVLVLWVAGAPRQLVRRNRLMGFAVMGVILILGLALEGWRLALLADRELFSRWLGTIGEAGSGLRGILPWAGWGILAAPILLIWRAREDKQRLGWLVLLLVLGGLTWHQARWGYFLILVYAMSLPWQLDRLRPGWAVWAAFVILLWPMWQEWDRLIWPPETRRAMLVEQRRDNVALRQAAQWMESQPAGGVLAPWWQSPALAYWSGHPAVAGSSHQSLPGIAATAKFYTSKDSDGAAEILRERDVQYVVAYEDSRVIANSALLLDVPVVGDDTMATALYRRPSSSPRFLRFAYANGSFKVFEVLQTDE